MVYSVDSDVNININFLKQHIEHILIILYTTCAGTSIFQFNRYSFLAYVMFIDPISL